MKQGIRDRTVENINRVKNLIKIYERTMGGSTRYDTDILRAAVVLLHAALEDCLRSIAYQKLPIASPDELHKTQQKVPLGRIALYRDRTVNELISDLVIEHLEGKTYNNSKDISTVLKSLAISVQEYDLSQLDIAIQRRHKIVHRADRSATDDEVGRLTIIRADQVLKWVEEVENFIGIVCDALEAAE